MLHLLEHGIRGLTEREAAELLVRYLADNGLSGSSLPIVASGPNSAFPHHRPGSRVIAEGDAVIFDFGGMEVEFGYHADTTRTYVVGKAPEGFAKIHDIVLRANQAAFEAAKPGVPCEAVDRAARELITRAGYGEYFTHRLGHGLGLDIHENPYITAGNNQAVQAGNCFSDEPGIYIPGKFGIRIEDALFIHQDGAERLTPLDHDITITQ
jgi:Xaa-Pro aminopeptidase